MVQITREPDYFPPPLNFLGGLGRRIVLTCRNSGRAILMVLEAIGDLRFAASHRNRSDVINQLYITGIKSLGVISVVALFTGMILALQTGLELRRFSQEVNIGTAVTVVMVREMGPFMTGL
ncbi:MAG: ABC transporter permease, partial [Kiritimatiellae bacterium]|nr:ABC transporter permease [Kiritimatiellia bacterium]